MRSKKAIKNIFSSLLLQIITLVCGFIVPQVLIRNFGSNINGLVTSITQFLAYITLLEAGVGPVIKATLYKPIAKKDKKEIQNILKASEKFFRMITYIFIIYIAVLCVVYPLLVNNEFGYIFSLTLILIIAISTIAQYYFGMTYGLYMQAEQKDYIFSYIKIITLIINTIFIVLLVKLDCSIHIVKLVSAIIFFLRPVVLNIYVKKKYDINLKEADSTYQLKQKWDGLAQHIAAVIHGSTDIAVITIFLNTIEVSVYSIYLMIITGIKGIIQAFTGGIDASFGDMIAKDEKENLNNSFRIYELFYFTITSLAYICTILLIVPFVKVYTRGITDANYLRPLFAVLIVIAEFIWAIRLPYSSITLAAGHFKETRKGAWVEAITNIVLSIVLIGRFGIVGVAIGTLVAMLIRTIEFMYHTSKYVLKRKIIEPFIRFGIVIVETFLTVLLASFLLAFEGTSYIEWVIYAIQVFAISIIIIIPINFVAYRNEVKGLFEIIKKVIKK